MGICVSSLIICEQRNSGLGWWSRGFCFGADAQHVVWTFPSQWRMTDPVSWSGVLIFLTLSSQGQVSDIRKVRGQGGDRHQEPPSYFSADHAFLLPFQETIGREEFWYLVYTRICREGSKFLCPSWWLWEVRTAPHRVTRGSVSFIVLELNLVTRFVFLSWIWW